MLQVAMCDVVFMHAFSFPMSMCTPGSRAFVSGKIANAYGCSSLPLGFGTCAVRIGPMPLYRVNPPGIVWVVTSECGRSARVVGHGVRWK